MRFTAKKHYANANTDLYCLEEMLGVKTLISNYPFISWTITIIPPPSAWNQRLSSKKYSFIKNSETEKYETEYFFFFLKEKQPVC